ncbi:hypothetical protein [Legionella sp. PC1000]|uniref:hypothetical protein n=1 Tax=Legionella sp. PC1000 TaxID=2746060 RepID=UPI0015FE391B|nr:hypothetical protein [Legionella sp. PC1000]
MINNIITVFSFILSAFALYYSKFYLHNSLVMNGIGISHSDKTIIRFSIGNIGNCNLLIYDLETTIKFTNESKEFVEVMESLGGNPSPEKLEIPSVIKPGEIQIHEVIFSRNDYKLILENKVNLVIIYQILTVKGKTKFLVAEFVPFKHRLDWKEGSTKLTKNHPQYS